MALKNLFADNWSKIDTEKRVELRKYCLNFLVDKGPDSKRQVINAVIMLLVKVVKMSWFDDKSHQEIIKEVLSIFKFSITH
jgi:hypothetical protein